MLQTGCGPSDNYLGLLLRENRRKLTEKLRQVTSIQGFLAMTADGREEIRGQPVRRQLCDVSE